VRFEQEIGTSENRTNVMSKSASKKPSRKRAIKKKKVTKKRISPHHHRLLHLAATASHDNEAAALRAMEALHHAEAAKHYFEAARNPVDLGQHLSLAERHGAEAERAADSAARINDLKYKRVPGDTASENLGPKVIARSTIHKCIQLHIGSYSDGTLLSKIYMNNAVEQACSNCASCSGMNYWDVENNPPLTIKAFEEAIVNWFKSHGYTVV
jgi:hypothetical protein